MAKTSFTKVIPSKTLENALRVGNAIVDYNGGKAIDKLTLAETMKLSPTSSTFIQIVSSSQMYGLTSGSVFSKAISLTDLGKNYFYQRTPEEQKSALFKAAIFPPLVKKIYDHFNKNKVPPFEFAKNILIRNFNVKESKTKGAWDIIIKNAKFIGILHKIQENNWINLDKIQIKEEPQKKTEGDGEKEEAISFEEKGDIEEETKQDEIENKSKQIKVFISHGKNKKILGQVKTMLEFGNFIPIIAEQQEATAIPVPEKVMTAMRECDSAIINISADETIKNDEGTEEYKINENVLIEVGAAFVLYNKKVILLVDKRIKLPSNLQGLYNCYYEGDELNWQTGMKVQKQLVEFKKNVE